MPALSRTRKSRMMEEEGSYDLVETSLKESTVYMCVCVSAAVLTICENLNVDLTTQRNGVLSKI